MDYKHLGRTGLLVSRLCLGTMNFGPMTSEPDSFEIMNHALNEGINYFDTANTYGRSLGEGVTEQIIGRWMAEDRSRRSKIVLATKVFGKMHEGPNQGRLSAYHIRQACEDSLRRLQTDHIDLYQMHHVDLETPWEEIWQAMEQLVSQGKVIYVGSSNFAAWNIAQAQETAQHRNFMGLVSEQSLYNLAERTIELEVIPACRAYGLGLVPWSPLDRGLLGGVLQKAAEGRRSSDMTQKLVDRYRPQLEQYESLCHEIDIAPGELALAWLLRNPAVTAPIIGPRTLPQLDSALHALEIQIPEDVLHRLDEIWPGPGGEAPMAYAW